MPKSKMDNLEDEVLASMSVATLQSQLDQLKAQQTQLLDHIGELESSLIPIRSEAHQVENMIRKVERRIAEASLPYKRGDIVADDQGVQYRVHEVYRSSEWSHSLHRYLPAGTVMGIRLTKTGMEAYGKAREIVSSAPLVKVEVK